MKKYVIDTNALISYVTDRNQLQQEIVAELFEAASLMKCSIICHQHVLTEFVFVMDRVYNVPKTDINAMVKDFIELPAVTLVHETDFSLLLSYWPFPISDFGDAIIAITCKSHKGSMIVSFDRKFKEALTKMGMPVH